MGWGFQAVLVLFIFLSSGSVSALDARILIDENTRIKEISGEFSLICKTRRKKHCFKSPQQFSDGQWSLYVEKKGLAIKNLKTNKKIKVRGRHFSLRGEFALEGRLINQLEIHRDKAKALWVIRLPIDQYLYGVMAAEVPASWPIESLKAQAIASRTYFMFKKAERAEEVFDVRSDTLDQVFRLDAKKHGSIKTAVDETHGLVLFSKKDKKVFPAYFHSDCGGHTSSENKVWRKPTALNRGVKDPYCRTASKNNWSYLMDRQKLLEKLHSVFYLPKGAQLKSILPRISKKTRAYIVDFIFSENIVKRINANDLRKLLGFGRLKSTQFEVKDQWQTVQFVGRGFGHGVGMCQWGAQRWARKGKNYRSILKHYYPGAFMQSLSKDQLGKSNLF